MTDPSPVIFNVDRTYTLKGKTYYLSEVQGHGFISDTGVYRLQVDIIAIPASIARELSDHIRVETLKFLAAKEVIPEDSALILVTKPPAEPTQ